MGNGREGREMDGHGWNGKSLKMYGILTFFVVFFLIFFQNIAKFDRKLSNMGHQVRKIVHSVTLFVDSVQIDRF